MVHTGPTAAIATIASGVQSQGVWTGRRQLFVRFAAEAETAILYTPEMLAKQLQRMVGQSPLHSISLSGRDPLASAGQILRFIEQAHAAAPGTKIVVHPAPGTERAPLERRYATLLEQGMQIHRDVELVMRIPGPVGVR